MMFGIGVAEQLDEAGLLVCDPDPAPTQLKAGQQVGVNSTHWMGRFTYDGVTALAGKTQQTTARGYGYASYYFPPGSLDNEVKSWLQGLTRIGPGAVKRRYEKVWNKKMSAGRAVTIVNNWGKPWGITAELIPVAFVKVA